MTREEAARRRARWRQAVERSRGWARLRQRRNADQCRADRVSRRRGRRVPRCWWRWDRASPLAARHAAPNSCTSPNRDFVALFAAPPAADSPQTRGELDELLRCSSAKRTPAKSRPRAPTARPRSSTSRGTGPATRRRFGTWPRCTASPNGSRTMSRPYVRAAKDRFLRLRPYEIEPRLKPCIDDVRGDLSYPSGHATYGYVMAYLLVRHGAGTARAAEARAQRVRATAHGLRRALSERHRGRHASARMAGRSAFCSEPGLSRCRPKCAPGIARRVNCRQYR